MLAMEFSTHYHTFSNFQTLSSFGTLSQVLAHFLVLFGAKIWRKSVTYYLNGPWVENSKYYH